MEYRFNSTIEEVLSNDEKSVRVKFSDGSEDSFDVLVAGEDPRAQRCEREVQLLTFYFPRIDL